MEENNKNNDIPASDIQDTVIKLKRQGWTIDEVINALNISKKEIELIFDLDSNYR